MGMTGVVVSVAINLIFLLIVYVVLRRRISRQGSTEYILGEVRSEINEMITELNQTADRNIGLLEARIARLQELIDKADSRLTLLHKETDKQKKGEATYSRVRPRILHPPQGEKHAPAADQAQQLDFSAGTQGDVPPGSFSMPSGTQVEGQGQNAKPSGGRTDATAEGNETSAFVSSHGNGQSASAGASKSRGGGKDADSRNAGARERRGAGDPDKRAKVIELHRQEISPDVIASRVGMTIGEVELIITMAEGRGK